MKPARSGLGRFVGELKRRRVFQVAAAYAVVGWILVEVADTVFPHLEFPEWTVTFVVWLVLLGFPLALLLAWAYDLTPDGMQPTPPRDESDEATTAPSRATIGSRSAGLIGVGILLGLGWWAPMWASPAPSRRRPTRIRRPSTRLRRPPNWTPTGSW